MLSVTSEVSSIQPIDGKLREPLEIRRNIRMCFCMHEDDLNAKNFNCMKILRLLGNRMSNGSNTDDLE